MQTILLLFDAHKLDISDEFKRTIEALRPHDEKTRVILNKADSLTGQQLMRVYGALMWSLGKVFKTPEVSRVYIGSFWNQPYQKEDFKKLFESEQDDLLRELYNLPKNSAIRKVNELVKRARLARVHAYIIGYLKSEMPTLFRKEKKQNKMLDDLPTVFNAVHKKYNIPMGDFPDLEVFREKLRQFEFAKFPKLDQKKIAEMDTVLAEDLPKLCRMCPEEIPPNDDMFSQKTNPFVSNGDIIPAGIREKATEIFNSLDLVDGKLCGSEVKKLLLRSNLSQESLGKIWELTDRDKDGSLNREEFVIATWLVDQKLSGHDIPDVLPPELIKSRRI